MFVFTCDCHISYLTAGHGIITMNKVSLSSFNTTIPTFTLFGDTSGGPPTTYTWTRNGQVINNNASYSISIQVNDTGMKHYRESDYLSTLVVTGRLPGVYEYSATNRAMTNMSKSCYVVEGISKKIMWCQ